MILVSVAVVEAGEAELSPLLKLEDMVLRSRSITSSLPRSRAEEMGGSEVET